MTSTNEPITDMSILKAFGKVHSLTFDSKFKYCISDAYYNDKGEYIPTIMEYKGNNYSLKYFSGCFNPFLVQLIKD